jgi:hypothetical protein
MGLFDLFKISSVSATRKLVSVDVARKIAFEWANVEAMLKGSTPAQLKQALITADKILDSALKDLSFAQSMSERLKEMRDRLDRASYQKMWDAHRLRNTLVHEIGFEPQHFILREAIMDIKNILYKLGVTV